MLPRYIRSTAQECIDKRVNVSRKVETDFHVKRQLIGGHERDRTTMEQGGDVARTMYFPVVRIAASFDCFAPEAESALFA
jgi:hypothetical protein